MSSAIRASGVPPSPGTPYRGGPQPRNPPCCKDLRYSDPKGDARVIWRDSESSTMMKSPKAAQTQRPLPFRDKDECGRMKDEKGQLGTLIHPFILHPSSLNASAAVGQAATHSAATLLRASARERLKGTPTRTSNPRPMNVSPSGSWAAAAISMHSPQAIHLPGSQLAC